jgi:hypothetical protein
MSSSSKRSAPLASIYVAELEKIWAIDKRIPTPASRKAWATARGLDPTVVHTWWYRRRPRAKKLKIRIPSDTYDLGIGRPPTPPLPDAPVVKVKRVRSKVKGKAKGKGRGKGRARAPVKVKVEEEQTAASVSSSALGLAVNVTGVKHEEDEDDQDFYLLWGSESSSGLRLSDDVDLDDLSTFSMRSSSPISSSSSAFFFPSSDDTPYDTNSSPPSSPILSFPVDEGLLPGSPFLELRKLMLERRPNASLLLRCPSPLQLDPASPGLLTYDTLSTSPEDEAIGDVDDPAGIVDIVSLSSFVGLLLISSDFSCHSS